MTPPTKPQGNKLPIESICHCLSQNTYQAVLFETCKTHKIGVHNRVLLQADMAASLLPILH
jgi:hypothetical protein